MIYDLSLYPHSLSLSHMYKFNAPPASIGCSEGQNERKTHLPASKKLIGKENKKYQKMWQTREI